MVSKNFIKILLIMLVCFFVSGQVFANSQKIERAQDFMEKFQQLSHTYDENLVDMYSENAAIIRIVEHSDGRTEKVILPTEGYKKTLKALRILAKFKGYKNYYKNLNYEIENGNIRITGERVNNEGYKAPVSILVGKNKNNEWKILEEKTKTKSVFLVKEVLSKIE